MGVRMPITIRPMSRRGFLKTTLAIGAGLVIGRETWADDTPAGFDRMILLSDPHLNADATKVVSDVNMTDHFIHVCEQVQISVGKGPAPLGLIINGDCAHIAGTPDDYKHMADLLGGVSSKVTTHLT